MKNRDKRDELLLLAAVSGEIPADWIGWAAGSGSYGAALLTRLKKDGEIKLRSKDGLRGYLLRAKAKLYLLEVYGKDTEKYLTGSAATNHVKSEPEKRLRLHRMSMVWVYFYRMGIAVFVSDKPPLFPALHPVPSDKPKPDKNWLGAYYGTAEWKLETDQEISGSRACGILTADEAYVVYNTMDSLMKWTAKIERNLKGRLELRFRRYGKVRLRGAVMLGTDMGMVKRILESDGGIKGNLYRVDEIHEAMYYIPLQKEVEIQIRLLCHAEAREKLHSFLCGALAEVRERGFGLEEGKDTKGRRVYFCYLLELRQLKRIREQQAFTGGRVFCFTYQAQILSEVLGDRFEIEAIRPEKVYQYLGWKEH